MLRKLLATALVLGLCVAVTGCEKEEATTGSSTGSQPVNNPDTGEATTPMGTEGMEIEEPEGGGQ